MLPDRRGRRDWRSLIPAVVLALAGVLLLPAAPAAADTRILCKGFAQCSQLGYGNDNYANNYQKMWWRMYAGHNCTNYAAYRMVRAGMSTERPWSGSGNASNWGVALADRTDQTPMVGSIAWWKSRNHVQYVERVLSSDHIVVSEDHWNGDFDWAEVRRGTGSWPDGFIHLRDAQVQMIKAPVITGTPKVGEPVKASVGTWRPAAALTYQWLRNGKPITGATSATYTPRPVDAGKRLALYVIARKLGYVEGKKTSKWAPATDPGGVRVVTQPGTTGVAKVGGSLTLVPAKFDPAPDSTAVQWLAEGQPVPGATGNALTLDSSLQGKRVAVQVTATRSGMDPVTATSAATEPVGPQKISAIERPKLTGTRTVGETMRLHVGQVDVAGATPTFEWRRNGVVFDNPFLEYTPTVSDLGQKITAWVTYAKAGYEPVTWKLNSVRTRARPRIAFGSPSSRKVAVRVVADGVSPVTGSVVLKDGQRSATLSLDSRGRAVFSARWIQGGKHKFTAAYKGSTLVRPKQRAAWVNVRP